MNCCVKSVQDVRTQGDRLEKLLHLIDYLGADIIIPQDIRDQDALELVFPGNEWILVIYDESNECQDLAFSVRQPLTVQGGNYL